MTEWEPATEAEAAMREALRGGDQEEYFRILARAELLLPVSADSIVGQAPVGWGTWTTSGRTHVLAFTSAIALQACLAENAGSARRMGYTDLANAWPNLEWWLAVNPGLPIEGYLPAWFVTQLSRGDVRLPGRSMAARARLEKAESAARARATAVVPGRVAPPAAEPTSPAPGSMSPSPAGAGYGSLAGAAAAAGGLATPAQSSLAAASGGLVTPPQSGFSAAGAGGLVTPAQGGLSAAGQGGLTTAAPSGSRGAEQVGEPQGATGPSAFSGARQSALSEGARDGGPRDSGPGAGSNVFGGAGGSGSSGFGGGAVSSGDAGSSVFGAAGGAGSSGFGAAGGGAGANGVGAPGGRGSSGAASGQSGFGAATGAGSGAGSSAGSSGFGAAPGAGTSGFGAASGPGPSGFGAAGGAGASGFGAAGGQGGAEASDGGGVSPGASRPGGTEQGDKGTSGSERRGPLQGGLAGLTSASIRGSIRSSLSGSDAAAQGGPAAAGPTAFSGAGGPTGPGQQPAPAEGQPGGPAFTGPPFGGGSAGGPPPGAISPLAAAPPPPVPGQSSGGLGGAGSPGLPRRVAGSGPAIPVGPIGANLPPIDPEPTPQASAAPTSMPTASNGTDAGAATARPWDTPPATQAWDASATGAPTQPWAASTTGPPIQAREATATGAPTQPWQATGAPTQPWDATVTGTPTQPWNEPAAPAPQVPPVQPPIDFKAANELEKTLLAAAAEGSTDNFLSTLLLAKVLVPVSPVSADGTRPGEPGFAWLTETIDAEPYVVVFTSMERLQDHLGEMIETIDVKFMQLIKAWPDPMWSFAVNPSTPVGAKLPGVQILALANWATEVGLGGDTEEIEPASRPIKKSTTPDPNQPTIMQKAVSRSQVDYYIERGYDRVSGFVHRANEVAHLNTPVKMYSALGLSYSGSAFNRDSDEIYVLRWPAYRPSLYRIPYGGQNEPAMRAMEGWVIERTPFRGNGFAPSESGDVIAEFKVDSARLPHGAQLWRITSGGVETLVALLDADAPTWRKVGER